MEKFTRSKLLIIIGIILLIGVWLVAVEYQNNKGVNQKIIVKPSSNLSMESSSSSDDMVFIKYDSKDIFSFYDPNKNIVTDSTEFDQYIDKQNAVKANTDHGHNTYIVNPAGNITAIIPVIKNRVLLSPLNKYQPQTVIELWDRSDEYTSNVLGLAWSPNGTKFAVLTEFYEPTKPYLIGKLSCKLLNLVPIKFGDEVGGPGCPKTRKPLKLIIYDLKNGNHVEFEVTGINNNNDDKRYFDHPQIITWNENGIVLSKNYSLPIPLGAPLAFAEVKDQDGALECRQYINDGSFPENSLILNNSSNLSLLVVNPDSGVIKPETIEQVFSSLYPLPEKISKGTFGLSSSPVSVCAKDKDHLIIFAKGAYLINKSKNTSSKIAKEFESIPLGFSKNGNNLLLKMGGYYLLNLKTGQYQNLPIGNSEEVLHY